MKNRKIYLPQGVIIDYSKAIELIEHGSKFYCYENMLYLEDEYCQLCLDLLTSGEDFVFNLENELSKKAVKANVDYLSALINRTQRLQQGENVIITLTAPDAHDVVIEAIEHQIDEYGYELLPEEIFNYIENPAVTMADKYLLSAADYENCNLSGPDQAFDTLEEAIQEKEHNIEDDKIVDAGTWTYEISKIQVPVIQINPFTSMSDKALCLYFARHYQLLATHMATAHGQEDSYEPSDLDALLHDELTKRFVNLDDFNIVPEHWAYDFEAKQDALENFRVFANVYNPDSYIVGHEKDIFIMLLDLREVWNM